MSHRKWRETKQQSSRARSSHHISCCLVSLHFLCDILTGRPVHLLVTEKVTVAPAVYPCSLSYEMGNICHRKICSAKKDGDGRRTKSGLDIGLSLALSERGMREKRERERERGRGHKSRWRRRRWIPNGQRRAGGRTLACIPSIHPMPMIPARPGGGGNCLFQLTSMWAGCPPRASILIFTRWWTGYLDQ